MGDKQLPDGGIIGLPSELDAVAQYDRGAALIAYLRKNKLIPDTTHAALATVLDPQERYAEAPEGVSTVVRLCNNKPYEPLLAGVS